MVYITTKQSPIYKQMSIEDMLCDADYICKPENRTITGTKTVAVDRVPYDVRKHLSPNHMIGILTAFNENYKHLNVDDKASLYHFFSIPKRSGGLRKISQPNDDLMKALRDLKDIFERDFGALYHTSAFAYIKNRCTIDAVKKHQANKSKWFGKFDLHDFFGSTTKEFVMDMLAMIYPFSEIIKDENGKKQLDDAISLAFLNGGLPQGTPFSPTITNIMMIPVDHILANKFRDFNGQRFCYTRYADDFLISSRESFNVKEIEGEIVKVLQEFKAPFSINNKKTRYGSSAGSNWNLGVMLNKDNQITVGHQKKKQLNAMLNNYILDRRNGKNWELQDIQTMAGIMSYYRMVERDNIDKIVEKMNVKYSVDVDQMIKDDIHSFVSCKEYVPKNNQDGISL